MRTIPQSRKSGCDRRTSGCRLTQASYSHLPELVMCIICARQIYARHIQARKRVYHYHRSFTPFTSYANIIYLPLQVIQIILNRGISGLNDTYHIPYIILRDLMRAMCRSIPAVSDSHAMTIDNTSSHTETSPRSNKLSVPRTKNGGANTISEKLM